MRYCKIVGVHKFDGYYSQFITGNFKNEIFSYNPLAIHSTNDYMAGDFIDSKGTVRTFWRIKIESAAIKPWHKDL